MPFTPARSLKCRIWSWIWQWSSRYCEVRAQAPQRRGDRTRSSARPTTMSVYEPELDFLLRTVPFCCEMHSIAAHANSQAYARSNFTRLCIARVHIEASHLLAWGALAGDDKKEIKFSIAKRVGSRRLRSLSRPIMLQGLRLMSDRRAHLSVCIVGRGVTTPVKTHTPASALPFPLVLVSMRSLVVRGAREERHGRAPTTAHCLPSVENMQHVWNQLVELAGREREDWHAVKLSERLENCNRLKRRAMKMQIRCT